MAELHHVTREEVIFEGEQAGAAYERARAMLLQFGFYDPAIVGADLPPGGVRAGLEFVQQVHVGPLRLKGPVRVLEAWDLSREAGFRYEAMPGHAEEGTASFALTFADGKVWFRMASSSAPAKWWVRLGAGAARRLQEKAIESAFRRMRAVANGEPLQPA